jgi:hypothetical protein
MGREGGMLMSSTMAVQCTFGEADLTQLSAI